MTVAAAKAPERSRSTSRSSFEAGDPVAVNGKQARRGHELIAELNKIGGKHGVGVRRCWWRTAWSA